MRSSAGPPRALAFRAGESSNPEQSDRETKASQEVGLGRARASLQPWALHPREREAEIANREA